MRAIVTGAGSGIGWATALTLADAPGARLLIVDRNAERREANLHTLTARGADAHGIGGDITDPAFPAAVVEEAAARLGGIDAIVSAAGSIANGAPLSDLPLGDFEGAFAVNVRPTLLLAQAAFPHLKASRGSLVAVSSAAAHHPVPSLGGYAPSKAALSMLVRQIALEWGPFGIRANAVSPGPTATPMAPAYADARVREARASTLPLRRIAEAEHVAATILFLLGPGAAAITGTDIDVDCGMGLTTMQLSGASLGRSTNG